MTGGSNPNPAARHSPLQKRLYLAGMLIAVAGVIAGALIYLTTPPVDPAISQYAIADPRYQIELQQIGGNMAVLMAQFHQWFDSLWHGARLGWTVAVLGIAIAGACFFVGHFFAYDDSHDAHRD